MAKLPSRMAPTKAVKPVVKPVVKPMAPAAVLGRAERVQRLEAGESRIARSQPPKAKPATPAMSAAATGAAQSALARAERIQKLEAGESRLVKKAPAVTRTTVDYRTTPAKKK